MKKLTVALLLCGVGWAQTPPVQPYEPKVQQSVNPVQVTLPTPPGVTQALPLSLDQALQLAFRNQQNLVVARSQVQAAQGRTEQTAAARNPKLGITSNYTDPLYIQAAGQSSDPSGGGGGFTNFLAGGGWNHSVSLNQLLFDFGHTKNQVRSREQAERSAAAAYDQTRANLVRDVKQAYYNVLSAQRLVAVQEENLANQRVHVTEARARFSSGLGLPSDVTRAETAVATAQSDLATAQNQLANNRLNLNLQLGLDPRTPVRIVEESEPAPLIGDANALFEQALQQRPELIQYQANVASAQAALDAAHTTSAPSVGASLTYQNRANPSFSSLNLGIAINYQLFDGGLQGGVVKEARANLEQAQAQYELARQRVKAEVGQAYLELQTAQQRVATATAEEANARETLRLATGRYRVGLGIFLDVVDAENALLRAQTNRVNAQTQLDLARATLARAVGEPLPEGLPEPVLAVPPAPVQGEGTAPETVLPVAPGAPGESPTTTPADGS